MGDTPGVEILQCIKYTFFFKNQHQQTMGPKILKLLWKHFQIDPQGYVHKVRQKCLKGGGKFR